MDRLIILHLCKYFEFLVFDINNDLICKNTYAFSEDILL